MCLASSTHVQVHINTERLQAVPRLAFPYLIPVARVALFHTAPHRTVPQQGSLQIKQSRRPTSYSRAATPRVRRAGEFDVVRRIE